MQFNSKYVKVSGVIAVIALLALSAMSINVQANPLGQSTATADAGSSSGGTSGTGNTGNTGGTSGMTGMMFQPCPPTSCAVFHSVMCGSSFFRTRNSVARCAHGQATAQ